MAKLLKIQWFAAKIETTKGTDSVPDATNSIDVEDVLLEMNPKKLDRKVLKRSMGNSSHILINTIQQIKFKVPLRVTGTPASGDSGTPELIHPLLAACGLTATYNASANITYSITNKPVTTITIYFNCDGILYKLTNTVGDFKINEKTAEIPYLEFTFIGKYNAPTATAIPSNIEDYFSTRSVVPCVGKSNYLSNIFTSTTLKGLFCFDADVTLDNSGNSNTLTNNSTVVPVDFGCKGIGAYFSGSNYLSRAYDADFDFGTDSFCIFGWIKCADTGAGGQYFLDRRSAGAAGFFVFTSLGKLVFKITDDGSNYDEISSTGDIDDNAWHFFVVRKIGTTSLEMQVDGVSMTSVPIVNTTGSMSNGSATLNIGCRFEQGAGTFITGNILGLGVAKTTLTTQNMKDMYRWVHDSMIRELNFAMNNKIFIQISDAGVSDIRITNRNPNGSIKLEQPSISDRNFYSEVFTNNPEPVLLHNKIGTTTANSQVITRIRSQFEGLKLVDTEGISDLDLPYSAYESSGNIDDQFELVFK